MRQIPALFGALALSMSMVGCSAQVTVVPPMTETSGVTAAAWGIGPAFDTRTVAGQVSAPDGIVSGGGGNIISGGGGNIISGGAGNIISGGGGNFRSLLALHEAPLGAAVVMLTNIDGVPLPGVAPVVTGSDGRYAFANVSADQTMVVRVAVMDRAGKSAWLERLLPVGADLSTADVGVTTTLATTVLRRRPQGFNAPVTSKEFAAMVRKASRVTAEWASQVTDLEALTRAADTVEKDITPDVAAPKTDPGAVNPAEPSVGPAAATVETTAADTARRGDRAGDSGNATKETPAEGPTAEPATAAEESTSTPAPGAEKTEASSSPAPSAAESTPPPASATQPEPAKTSRPSKQEDADRNDDDRDKDKDKDKGSDDKSGRGDGDDDRETSSKSDKPPSESKSSKSKNSGKK